MGGTEVTRRLTESEARRLLAAHELGDAAAETPLRRIRVGFRTEGASSGIGASDLVVTDRGLVLRVPSVLPDDQVRVDT